MTETNSQTEPISELSEVVTASEAPKLTESAVAPPIKKPPSQAKLAALEKARNSRSEKAKEKRALAEAAAAFATPPPPAKDLNYFLEVHKEGLAAFPEYESLVKPPLARPVLKFV
jgi:hypothetical protein